MDPGELEMLLSNFLVVCSIYVSGCIAAAATKPKPAPPELDPSLAVSAKVDGKTFIYKVSALVASLECIAHTDSRVWLASA